MPHHASPSRGLSYSLRLLFFTSLELSYLTLGAVCLKSPIALPTSWDNHQSLVRGGLTIITVLWQTLAILPLTNILSEAFSSEWSHVYAITGHLQPGRTDRVSVASAGELERLRHALLSEYASWAFRSGVMASLLALALSNLAPGSLTTSTLSLPVKASFAIGNFTLDGPFNFPAPDNSDSHPNEFASTRAASITRLEQLESSHFQYTMDPPNCVVGWPNTTFLQNSSQLTYSSDSACWSHSCRWEVPGQVVGGAFFATEWNTTVPSVIKWSLFELSSQGVNAQSGT
jgi:hypothetical protein